ncbi:putative diaminohydroxyphosphoribosylamino-pyrimidine deaminase [Phaeomoniella chlamydospora]|uniref:Putative diaminohydroxyphosphoribosylamino-pyrimidine deaminase n=1 Tax=Phaeomoniella chlamydospora TaxID=158046 RepID=A0A0G2EPR8_PHACM|nr:putative diaminohydroxyphosphoribosylamino-pyrimidine deaminase [Phaeomoniella chlamydospora]
MPRLKKDVAGDAKTFELFSQQIPSSNLGFVDSKATAMDLDIGKKSFSVNQSPGLLHSQRSGGTTGAVLWKVTPLIAQWLSDKTSVFWKAGALTSEAIVAELGCGISGLIGLAVHQDVRHYILTDQAYVFQTLRQNIIANTKQEGTGRKKIPSAASDNLHLLPFDWEADSAENLKRVAGSKGIDLLIACDCIYNDFLVIPFVQACRDVCQLRRSSDHVHDQSTLILVAQQQRSDEVFELWLKEMMKYFQVWRLQDDILPDSLKSGTGYLLHIAVLKS